MMMEQPHWPAGTGEMAGLIRSHDWKATPLGPIEAWPQSLKTIVDLMLASPSMMSLVWGPEAIHLYNDRFTELLQEHRVLALGRSAYETFARSRDVFEADVAAGMAGRSTHLLGQRYPVLRQGDLQDAWFDVEYAPIHDEAGVVAGVLWTLKETTAQHLAERALRASETRHRLLIESWAQAEWETDADGVVTTDSPSWRAYTGQSLKEWLGYGWLDAIHPEDRTYAERHWREAITARQPINAEFRLRAPGGNWRWTNVRAAPVLNERGDVQKWAGMNINIDDRRKAEAALHENEARQAFLLRLSDALRPIRDSIEIQRTATQMLGEQLKASRVFYVLVERDGDAAAIYENYTSGVSNRVGRYSLSAFSSAAAADWRAGRVASTSDVNTDPRYSQAEREAYASVSTRAGFGVPLIKEGKLAAVLGVNQSVPRHWTTYDIELASEVAERTWAAIERARAEAALRESEERFRQFGEASQDVLWIRDVETFQWEYLTPAFETIYGLDRETALSGDNMANWLDLVIREDREHAAASLRRVRDGEWVTFEFRIRRPQNGEVRWLRNTDFPIRDVAGQVVRIGGVGQDVTDLKQAEEALAAAELRQRALIEGIPQLVWRAVDGGEWTWASPQWTQFTGQPEIESHDWGWLDTVHPDDRKAARQAWATAIDTGGFEVEYRIRHAGSGNCRWFQTRATPVRDGGGAMIEWLGTSNDIHDLRAMQERQAVLVAELQHRTRNLIGVVRSTAEMTARASTTLEEFAAKFRSRLEALARVQGLLSRLNEGDRVTFDELIGTELSALGQADGSDKVTLNGPAGVALRSSTVQTFALALHELATNAVKYGALKLPDGHLSVTWRLERPDGEGQPWLHVDWHESGVAMPPANTLPQGSGTGRTLIERALPYQLGAKTTYVMASDGVRCSISLPVSRRTATGDGNDGEWDFE